MEKRLNALAEQVSEGKAILEVWRDELLAAKKQASDEFLMLLELLGECEYSLFIIAAISEQAPDIPVEHRTEYAKAARADLAIISVLVTNIKAASLNR